MPTKKALGILIAFSITLSGCSAPTPEGTPDLTLYADQLITENYLPALPGVVVAVAEGDDLIYKRAFGTASAELNVPLSENSVMRIGSVTKQLTAAGILYLVDEGKLSLDDPLSKFLPYYPNGDNISVKQLLNHTSGIVSYTNLPGIMDGPIRLDRSTTQLIEQFKDQTPDFAPGEKYRYNNSGYVLLGAIIEKITNQSWHDYLQQELLLPNDIKFTEYGGNERLISNQVSGYTMNGGNLAPAGLLSMTQPHAAGALVSDIKDLVLWNQLLHTDELLTSESYTQMITPTGTARSVGYGFGIHRDEFRNETMLHHGGGIHGFSSYLVYLPQSDISVVILQNSDARVFGDYSPKDIALRIAAFAINKPFLHRSTESLSSSTLKALEGVYQSGNAKVELHLLADKLLLVGANRSPVSLLVVSEQTFLHPDGYSGLEFKEQNGSISFTYTTMADAKGEVFERQPAELSPLMQPISQEELALFEGQFQGLPGNLTLSIKNNGLTARLNDQPGLTMSYLGDGHFFIAETGAEILFAQSNNAEQLTIRQGGRQATMTRSELPN